MDRGSITRERERDHRAQKDRGCDGSISWRRAKEGGGRAREVRGAVSLSRSRVGGCHSLSRSLALGAGGIRHT